MLNCWLESYNFHSFIESTYFNEIHQFTIDQLYTSSQIDSFYWVISIEDFRRIREFQIEKHQRSQLLNEMINTSIIERKKVCCNETTLWFFLNKNTFDCCWCLFVFISSNFYSTIIKIMKLIFD